MFRLDRTISTPTQARGLACVLAILLAPSVPIFAGPIIHPPVTVSASATSTTSGTPYTVSVQLTPTSGGPVPTGTVSLSDNGFPIATLTLNSSASASYTVDTPSQPLYPEPHTYRAYYSGNEYYTGTDATPTVVTVTSTQSVHAQDFGSVEIGSSVTTPIQLSFNRDATLGSVNVVTQGLTGYDFQRQASNPGDCQAGASFTKGALCTVYVTFSPKGIGLREGGVTITDANNVLIATKYLAGNGRGGVLYNTKQLQVKSLNLKSLNEETGQKYSWVGGNSIAIDPSGVLYLAGSGLFKVDSNGTPHPFSVPKTDWTLSAEAASGRGGLALDGVGNLYLGFASLELLRPGANYLLDIATPTQSSNYNFAIDGTGTILLPDGNTKGHFYTLPPDGIGNATSTAGVQVAAVTPVGDGSIGQGNGTVYGAGFNIYSKTSGQAVVERPLSPILAGPPGSFVGDLGLRPAGIAVDATGTVYATDYNNYDFVVLTPDGTQTQIQVPRQGGIGGPAGMIFDGNQRLYIVQSDNVFVYKGVLPSSLNFGSAAVGQAPATLSLQLTNQGNDTVHLTTAVSSTQFKVVGGCTPSIPASTSCTLQLSFTPSSAAPTSATLTLKTDHSPLPTQTVTLTGTGVAQ